MIKGFGGSVAADSAGVATFAEIIAGPLASTYAASVHLASNPSGASVACGQDADEDGDGIRGLLDNCQSTFNPAQTDTDHDGFGDACDPVVIHAAGPLGPSFAPLAVAGLSVIGFLALRGRRRA